MNRGSCKSRKKRQISFEMKGTVCAKGKRREQENSSGLMMLGRVEVGDEAKMSCVGQC